MFVSPAEPAVFRQLGVVSLEMTEKLGVDFMIPSAHRGRIGVQRKAIDDLVASLRDGRVSREMFEMKQCDIGVWMIEGQVRFTSDGELVSRARFTEAQWHGVLFALQQAGFWLLRPLHVTESIRMLKDLERWAEKAEHGSLLRRPGMGPDALGEKRKDPRDWQAWFLQGLPGVGLTTARAILDYFGRLPLRWEDDVDLTEVPGIGRKMSETIREVVP